MKRIVSLIISIISFILLLYSCSRELSFENGGQSKGYFVKDNAGNCIPFSNSENFVSGVSLADSNFIMAPLYITKAGAYFIHTDTINGYFFQASGNFKDTDFLLLKLPGSGKPVVDGTDEFTIYYNDSICHFYISVKKQSVANDSASYTLEGSPDMCINASLSGNYIKGFNVDSSCKISIGVNISVPGNYSISTNSVNGYQFSGSGSFVSTGIQTVLLTASGTPLNAGTDVFTVTAGASTCTFSVLVNEPVISTNLDHFPLTKASFWTYDDLYHSGQMINRSIVDTATFNGKLYTGMEERIQTSGPVVYYFRKTGIDYFEFGSVDKYTTSVTYVPEIDGDIAFLHENLSTGDTWNSTEYSGTINGGQTVLLQYVYTCTNANASLVINGKAFTNVYKIQLKPRVSSLTGPYNFTGEEYDLYYSKGVGLIYLRKIALGYNQSEMQIRNWQVN